MHSLLACLPKDKEKGANLRERADRRVEEPSNKMDWRRSAGVAERARSNGAWTVFGKARRGRETILFQAPLPPLLEAGTAMD
jgi:hypothetical protein